MKINELKKAIEFLGYKKEINLQVEEFEEYVSIYRLCGLSTREIARVNLEYNLVLDVDFTGFKNLPEEIKEELFNLLLEFARTPTDEREEEKKYIITHKFFSSKNYYAVNLVWNQEKDIYRLISCSQDNNIYQALFSKEEIEEIKERLNTDLADFRIVEVE